MFHLSHRAVPLLLPELAASSLQHQGATRACHAQYSLASASIRFVCSTPRATASGTPHYSHINLPRSRPSLLRFVSPRWRPFMVFLHSMRCAPRSLVHLSLPRPRLSGHFASFCAFSPSLTRRFIEYAPRRTTIRYASYSTIACII